MFGPCWEEIHGQNQVYTDRATDRQKDRRKDRLISTYRLDTPTLSPSDTHMYLYIHKHNCMRASGNLWYLLKARSSDVSGTLVSFFGTPHIKEFQWQSGAGSLAVTSYTQSYMYTVWQSYLHIFVIPSIICGLSSTHLGSNTADDSWTATVAGQILCKKKSNNSPILRKWQQKNVCTQRQNEGINWRPTISNYFLLMNVVFISSIRISERTCIKCRGALSKYIFLKVSMNFFNSFFIY